MTDDEVVKEAEAAIVERVSVDFPGVDADRKYEAVLRDAVAEEVLAPAGRAPPTGWRVDRFPQGLGNETFMKNRYSSNSGITKEILTLLPKKMS